MPDRSTIVAWTAAIVLIAAAAGGYLIWIHRTRAGYHARSLSASNRPPEAPPDKTRNLHVDGCDKDFLVKIGELVEPRAIPGATLQAFEEVYGKPSKRGKPGIQIWDTEPFSLAEGVLSGTPADTTQPPFVLISLNQGHVVQTLDDVELGIDSFASIFRKARDRNIEIHERIQHNISRTGESAGASWTLTVSFDSSCGRRFRSEYSRTLAATPEIDREINPPPSKSDGQIAVQQAPYRSSVFMNKLVSEYTMVLSNGQSDSKAGSPSEHE
jgi:hypothetical protein